MKTALLAQNDDLAIDNLKQNVGRSVFDLSHTTTFPIDVDGAILPICALETVPSDSLDISCEILLRQLAPLVVPTMTRFTLNTAWFWCDNRLAWKKWDRFMTGGRDGNEVYQIPTMYNAANGSRKFLLDTPRPSGSYFMNSSYKNCLHTYFGIQFGHKGDEFDGTIDDTNELPVAFPFFDYQLICRDFYTDVDRLPKDPLGDVQRTNYGLPYSDWAYSNLFPVDDDEIRLKDGPNLQSGFHSGDDEFTGSVGFMLDKVRYHNVRDDYFTSSKKAPMRGDVPTVDTSIAVSNIDPSEVIGATPSSLPNATLLALNGDSITAVDNLNRNVASNDGQVIQQVSLVEGFKSGSGSSLDNLYNALSKLKVELRTTKAISAAELRLLSQLTVWQELNMLHKPYYDDFLNAHFNGVRVGESAVEKPQYIGGTSQIININEVLQTSASSSSNFLGSQGAVAGSLASNHVGKFFCNNYGWLIGVCYIIPDMYYEPALPRSFSRRTKEDFYSPEFANLSMQATLNKEIFYSDDDDWNNTPWGYTGAFDELRSVPNRIAGDLLNENYTDLSKWVLRRKFTNDNKPAMNSAFLSLHDNVDMDAWSVPGMPKFMLQCANYVKAVRPMPYVAIPKAL